MMFISSKFSNYVNYLENQRSVKAWVYKF